MTYQSLASTRRFLSVQVGVGMLFAACAIVGCGGGGDGEIAADGAAVLDGYVADGSVVVDGSAADAQTADVANNSEPYVLFNPTEGTTAYLMNLAGREVHKWSTSAQPGQSVYLRENGNLFRTERVEPNLFEMGGTGGGLAEYDWNGNKLWSFTYATSSHWQHHDAEVLPNGHILFIAWDKKSKAEAVAAGRSDAKTNANGIWSEQILEYDPSTNAIVWQWNVWDHLIAPGSSPISHPELIDPNVGATIQGTDWLHINSVKYNATLDQIAVSVHNLNEMWIIDHGTTTAQAASHSGGARGRGGDLLYRWGSPSNYGGAGATQMYWQHDAEWIPAGYPGAGNITIFDNGKSQQRNYSRVLEIVPPIKPDGTYDFANQAFGPSSPIWVYSPTPTFFASNTSGAHRLPSGNTFVSDGPHGRMFEVTPAGATVWEYTVRSSSPTRDIAIFRGRRYEANYPAFQGRTLTPGGTITVTVAAGPGGGP